jgi:hypothetical protein
MVKYRQAVPQVCRWAVIDGHTTYRLYCRNVVCDHYGRLCEAKCKKRCIDGSEHIPVGTTTAFVNIRLELKHQGPHMAEFDLNHARAKIHEMLQSVVKDEVSNNHYTNLRVTSIL